MAWTGNVLEATDVLNALNKILKNYDKRGVEELAVYGNPFLARLEKKYDKNALFVGAGGRMSVKTGQPMNARPRGDAEDVAAVLPHDFDRMTWREIEYMASTGITMKQLEQCKDGPNAVASLAEIKLEDLQADIRFRLNNAVKGDGTGRLARVASYNAGTKTVTVDNTGADFGWPGTHYIVPGMTVDILTPSATTWTVKARKVVVLSKTATTLVIDEGAEGVISASPADNDIVFHAGVIRLKADNTLDRTDEIAGLFQIIDDGAASWVGGGTGSYLGDTFQGVTRSAVPQLRSNVERRWDINGDPDSWELEDVLKHIRRIDFGYGKGKVTALYADPDMVQQTARKAAEENMALVPVTNGKVTGGWYTEELRTSTGRTIPVIPMQDAPPNTIFGVCEPDLEVYYPIKIGFTGPDGRRDEGKNVFFPAPGARNLTFEAWIRCELQILARRTDNCFRIEGLRDDE